VNTAALDGGGLGEGVDPADLAIRLEKVFGSTADTWLGMQMQHDLWEARQRTDKIRVNRRFGDAMPS
jgi:plasmid maintenance system antidote protein VapI